MKWVHIPSRVPGCRQALTTSCTTDDEGRLSPPSDPPLGASRTTNADRTATSRPREAADVKAYCHPAWPSRATSGTALRIWPPWPASPVTCVISGTRRGGNQAVTSRSTLTNVIASPIPTSTRPSTASVTVSASASCS